MRPCYRCERQHHSLECRKGQFCRARLAAAVWVGAVLRRFKLLHCMEETISVPEWLVCSRRTCYALGAIKLTTTASVAWATEVQPPLFFGNMLVTPQVVVLDEADRILDLGFRDQLNSVLEYLPPSRQTMLFSATQTKSVKDLARLSLKKVCILDRKPSVSLR